MHPIYYFDVSDIIAGLCPHIKQVLSCFGLSFSIKIFLKALLEIFFKLNKKDNNSDY